MIAIIDYGVGNLFSLQSSLKFIGADAEVTNDIAKIKAADRIILPGVGAFADAIRKLRESGMEQVVLEEAANGKPVLVMYAYQHDLTRIQQRFGKYGSENPNGVRELKTSADLEDWNAGKIPVAVTQPASTGHGLNLQAGGSTLIWFGLTWSLELYQQTNARLWRQGQTADTVVIHHIITKDTIDERILSALHRKEKTQTALIDAVKANLEG